MARYLSDKSYMFRSIKRLTSQNMGPQAQLGDLAGENYCVWMGIDLASQGSLIVGSED